MLMTQIRYLLGVQRPAVVTVVDHKPGLTAINTDVFAGDETGFVGGQEQHHVGDIQRIAHPAGRLLDGVGAFVDGVSRVDPAGRDGVDPHLSGEADRQRMGQRGNSALGSGVAFTLGLAHPIPGGRDIDDAAPRGEVWRKQFAQIERRGNADCHGLLELLIGAFVDTQEQGRRVVHQHIHPTIFPDNPLGKVLQCGLVGKIAHIMVTFCLVDDANMGAVLLELLGDTLANPVGTAGDNDYFVLEHGYSPAKLSV